MRPVLAFSVRSLALPAFFCLLGIGSGCGRETFDLLPGTVGGFAGAQGGISGLGGVAGSMQDTGGSVASSGSAGSSGSSAGATLTVGGMGGQAGAAFGGAGGRFSHNHGAGSSSIGGMSGAGGCAGGNAGCSGRAFICTPSEPFCTACHSVHDCDTRICDSGFGCIDCRTKNDCPSNETCTLIHRCAKTCKTSLDCTDDAAHPFCEMDLQACVSCLVTEDCALNPNGANQCYHNACVECFDDTQCPSHLCNSGHCAH